MIETIDPLLKPYLLAGGGEADDFALVAPVATAVAEAAPLFVWDTLPGAPSYRVRVFTAAYALAAESPPLTAPRWRPNAPLAGMADR